jgi:heme-degrading monooxygenase HmoA
LSADPFTYIWAYRVPPERVDEFRSLYGPDGPWVRLFRQAPGYLDTVLYRDRNDGARYLTIDRWESEEAFRDFRARFAEDFDRLDSDGEHLTLEETPLGELGPDGIGDGERDP